MLKIHQEIKKKLYIWTDMRRGDTYALRWNIK